MTLSITRVLANVKDDKFDMSMPFCVEFETSLPEERERIKSWKSVSKGCDYELSIPHEFDKEQTLKFTGLFKDISVLEDTWRDFVDDKEAVLPRLAVAQSKEILEIKNALARRSQVDAGTQIKGALQR